MTEFLVKHFVKDYEKTEKVSVRTGYGILASMVGIFCNVLLFLMKITIGMMIHSISVIADAFNNLNIAETARQLHMHRNTLIYRLEQIEKQTGLDLRLFDDPMTFKIAMMVINYLKGNK